MATRARRASATTRGGGVLRLENDLIVAPALSPAAASVFAGPAAIAALGYKQLLVGEIKDRIGAPYVYGASGPWKFDCSGFVWSVFRDAGITFERSSARSLWQQFAPVGAGEEYRFGTLVFFNNLRHVGIVADQNGFYHASVSHGVTYSPFNEYWSSRIDGFRRIPEATTAAGLVVPVPAE